jgi:hypothetical protein
MKSSKGDIMYFDLRIEEGGEENTAPAYIRELLKKALEEDGIEASVAIVNVEYPFNGHTTSA